MRKNGDPVILPPIMPSSTVSVPGSLTASTALPLGRLRLLHGSWRTGKSPSLHSYRAHKATRRLQEPSIDLRRFDERVDFVPISLPGSAQQAGSVVKMGRYGTGQVAMSFNRSLALNRQDSEPDSDQHVVTTNPAKQAGLMLPLSIGSQFQPQLRISSLPHHELDLAIEGRVSQVSCNSGLSLLDGTPDAVRRNRTHPLARTYRQSMSDRHPLYPLDTLIRSRSSQSDIFRCTEFRFQAMIDQVMPFVKSGSLYRPAGSTDYRLRLWIAESEEVDSFGEPILQLQYLLFTQTTIVEADGSEAQLFPALSSGTLKRHDQCLDQRL